MNARKKSRRRPGQSRSGFVLALLAFLIFVALLILSAGLFFKVSEIRVEGVSVILPERVREASGIQLDSNIFLIDKFKIMQNIFDAFPYARAVSVRRSLPNAVVLSITEAVPACAFTFQGYYWVTDRDGRILENSAALGHPGIPVIRGVTPLAPVIGEDIVFSKEEEDKRYALFPLLEALEQNDMLEQVREINVEQSFEIKFLYADRLEVLMGFPNDFDYKLSYILPSLDKLDELADNQKARLDLSSVREKNALLIPLPE